MRTSPSTSQDHRLGAGIVLVILSTVALFFTLFANIGNGSATSHDSSIPTVLPELEIAEANYQKNQLEREILKQRLNCSQFEGCDTILFRMIYLIPVYQCYHEIHLGQWSDRGKWVCDIPGAVQRNTGVVYSVGADADPQFEKAVFERFGIVPYTFDPAMSEENINKLKSLEFMKFSEVGITGAKDLIEELITLRNTLPFSKNARLMNLMSIMESLNHSYVDVLKMDCEGCEASFIQSLPLVMTRGKPLFGHFVIEFHRLDNGHLSGKLFEVLESLGYREFHAEPNFPLRVSVWELSFIHESLVLPRRL